MIKKVTCALVLTTALFGAAFATGMSVKPVLKKKTSSHHSTVVKLTAGSGKTVNINTATLDQLQSLPHVGPKFAQRIVSYRKQNGPFKELSALTSVKGFSPAKIKALQGLAVAG